MRVSFTCALALACTASSVLASEQLSGRVVTRDGRPVANAAVFLRGEPSPFSLYLRAGELLGRARSDRRGRFSFVFTRGAYSQRLTVGVLGHPSRVRVVDGSSYAFRGVTVRASTRGENTIVIPDEFRALSPEQHSNVMSGAKPAAKRRKA